MSTLRRIAPRLLNTLPILLLVSVLAFLLNVLGPGDPVQAQYGTTMDQAQIDAIRDAQGLNDPLVAQYASWVAGLFTAGGGESLVLGGRVFDVLLPSFANTLVLTLAGVVLCVLFGTAIGLLAGIYHGTWVDRALMFVVQVGSNLSVYWFGLVLISFFSLTLGWLPVGGMASRGGGDLLDLLSHLVLPALAAALISMLVLARFVRIGVIREQSAGYFRTFRSQGFTRGNLLRRNVFRNIAPSIINITGLEIGTLITGVFFVEIVFNWPGIGTQLVNAVNGQDYPVIQGGIMLVCVCYLLINLLTDVAVDSLDPKLRSAA